MPVYTQPRLVVFDVGHVWIREGSKTELLSLGELASEIGVNFRPYDLGWTYYTPDKGEQSAIAIDHADAYRFLDAFAHYEIKLLDFAADPPPERMDEIALSVQTLEWPDSPALLHSPESNIYVHSHDDCYTTLEARSKGFVEDALAVALATFVGNMAQLSEVRLPDRSLLQLLTREGATWVAHAAHVSLHGGVTEIGLSEAKWRLADPPPESVDVSIEYVVDSGTWNWPGKS